MNYFRSGNRIVLRVERGAEIMETIKRCCEINEVRLGSILGIGATDDAEIGLYVVRTRDYHSKRITGDHEITNLSGNISTMNGEVYLHVHATLANEQLQVTGGHLNHARVSATCEVVIDIIEGALERERDEETGLNLLLK